MSVSVTRFLMSSIISQPFCRLTNEAAIAFSLNFVSKLPQEYLLFPVEMLIKNGAPEGHSEFNQQNQLLNLAQISKCGLESSKRHKSKYGPYRG